MNTSEGFTDLLAKIILSWGVLKVLSMKKKTQNGDEVIISDSIFY